MTAPGNLTEWKATILTQLYTKTRSFLARGPEAAALARDRGARLLRRRRRVEARVGPEARARLDEFLSGIPDRYLALLRSRQIAEHLRLATSLGDLPAAISVRARRRKGYDELLVVAKDSPGLLARITGVLLAHRIDVMAAQIHSRTAPPRLALDLFLVRDRSGRVLRSDDPRWSRVSADLDAVLSGRERLEDVIERHREKLTLPPRVTPEVPTEIEIDNEVSDDYTVIDVYTQDRLGVLHAITRTLSELGLDIALSKVATEAARVADVFYVRKVIDPERLAGIKESLGKALRAIS